MPPTPDSEFDHLVVEALQTLPMPAPMEVSLFERLKTIEEFISGAPLPLSQPALLYRDENSAILILPIAEKITVGRGLDCELAFPDQRTFSRHHFAIAREDGCFVLRDRDSRNGTSVNGQAAPVTGHELRNGDIISAGGRLFVFTSR